MRILKPGTVAGYAERHPAASAALTRWLAVTRAADWSDHEAVRASYRSAVQVKVATGAIVTVFNIAGNRFRLIVAIHYDRRIVFIRDFLTHAAYDKNRWKDQH